MVKAKLHRQTHREAYTYTLTESEKGKKNLYIRRKKYISIYKQKKKKEESNQINRQIYQ